MKTGVISGDITKLATDAIIVNLFEGVDYPTEATAAVDEALGGAITQLINEGEIKGKVNELTLLHTLGKIPSRRVLVVGLGKQQELNLDKIRGVASESCKLLKKVGVERVASIAHGSGVGGIDPERAAQAVTEGSILGLYAFDKHKVVEPETRGIKELIIVERDDSRLPALKRGVFRGGIMAEATNLARDMVNEPANFMTPADMVETARKVAAAHRMECTVLEREQMRELGMGALLGVAQGSHQPPKFIVLHYGGDEPSTVNLGLIGKGITFDSGGISIKPSEKMDEMKGDMAGGATVIAAVDAIARLGLKLNVTALVPAAENLPGGAALKPGDILTAMSGKTIEIANTDAEGRLILADALCYARKLGLSPLVDIATLTGACRVALGDLYTGVFGNSQELLDKVIRAGEEAGERIWQMPMPEEYKEQNKSEVADVKNSGGRYAGAITAAQFLSEFVQDTPWVHLDIAGPSYLDKAQTYNPKGATGAGVRTFINLALILAQK